MNSDETKKAFVGLLRDDTLSQRLIEKACGYQRSSFYAASPDSAAKARKKVEVYREVIRDIRLLEDKFNSSAAEYLGALYDAVRQIDEHIGDCNDSD